MQREIKYDFFLTNQAADQILDQMDDVHLKVRAIQRMAVQLLLIT